MAPRLISLASTKTSPNNMGHGQRVADWGDRRLSGTIVPTCDRPIGDGPGREANVNGAGKEDAVNYKNNPLRQASKCAGDAGLCPECSRQQRLALHPFHLQPPKQLHLLPLIALGHQHQELSRHRHRRSMPTRRILQRRLRRPLPQRPQFLVIGWGQLLQPGVQLPGFSARAGIAMNGQAVCRDRST
jgi:hypothetical protein